eukprot:5079500-Lingulodinium_polyedra.AAC.1
MLARAVVGCYSGWVQLRWPSGEVRMVKRHLKVQCHQGTKGGTRGLPVCHGWARWLQTWTARAGI